MPIAKNVLRFIIPRVIGFRPFRHLTPLAEAFQRNAYRLRYLSWYNAERVEQRLLKTPRPLDHENRFLLYRQLAERFQLDASPINYLEFGVATGTSIKWWLETNRHAGSRFFGFDTFTGLPEAWATEKRGGFSTGGAIPQVEDGRCRFIKGMFQATLGAELGQMELARARTMVHLDADLYSSTLFVLMTLDAHLKPGDLIIIDEFAHANDEFRAFLDYSASTGRRLEPIAAVNHGDVIAFETTPLT